MKVLLEFKKEDFAGSYKDSEKCAITTALHRAGLFEYRDEGTDIVSTDGSRYEATNKSNADYQELVSRVINIYKKRLPLEDFTFELELNIP